MIASAPYHIVHKMAVKGTKAGKAKPVSKPKKRRQTKKSVKPVI